MPVSLDEIVSAVRARVAEATKNTDLKALERDAANHTPRGFAKALRTAAAAGPAVIAELKKASPSRGMIRASFHAAGLASELFESGASALSVLTEEQFFQGSLDYLREASAAMPLPCLRKDFIVDEFQILEARANHADAILLIIAALTLEQLGHLGAQARSLGLDVLCEIHDERELTIALDNGFEILGVNSRDLRTFTVDLNAALRLGTKLPERVLRVAESGIHSANDLLTLQAAGYQAFLIGESLMAADRPGQELANLLRETKRAARKVVVH
ncbi:MAG TPA: indole-3-glycerol phosphate synthase TrpC [Terriglobales bacterium]|nr:indole-3-glycerol phosphate synthase TrpC [Terriglobales bacterium]